MNQRGFFTILGLFVIMFLTSLVFITAYIFHITQGKSDFRETCYRGLHDYQNELQSSMQQILILNGPIFQNRQSILLTERLLNSAQLMNQPALVVGLAQQLALLRQIQLRLGQIQQTKKKNLEFILTVQLVKLQTQGLSTQANLSGRWRHFTSSSNQIQVIRTQTTLPLVPDDAHSPAPLYRIAPDLELKSQVKLIWDSRIFAAETNSFKQEPHPLWSFTCTSFLSQNNNRIKIVINADKL